MDRAPALSAHNQCELKARPYRPGRARCCSSCRDQGRTSLETAGQFHPTAPLSPEKPFPTPTFIAYLLARSFATPGPGSLTIGRGRKPSRTPAWIRRAGYRRRPKGYTRHTVGDPTIQTIRGFRTKVTENKTGHFCKVCVAARDWLSSRLVTKTGRQWPESRYL